VGITLELIADGGDGMRFMEDLCTMLERIAQREGVTLEAMAPGATTRAYQLAHQAEVPPALLHECGLHRAQLVPRGSTTGRICTSKVRVDTTRDPRASPDVILKTYNYPQRWVVWHASGAKFPLDDMLAGLTPPPD